MNTTGKNHLAAETSPYLRQHADNPVQWYPWSDEALDRARREDRPILLSIGYSACHWCHVMAHESFEDAATAAVMNRLFVNIKVDREERPDLDKIYQLAHQILTHRPGGWPLNLFLTPDDHIPFFAGTYFPKTPRYNLPSFVSLLHQVADYYHREKRAITEFRAQFSAAVESITAASMSHGGTPKPELVQRARDAIGRDIDPQHGGFSGAPKFPHAPAIEFLLRYRALDDPTDNEGLEMALLTLRKMAEGGLYDQLGGGFCRYSVDDRWLIPHFEKMLYDNAALLALYSQAWQATGEPLFRQIALETAGWVMREMQSADGGYYSSLDADSEGEEGRYYVWDRDEVRSLLTGPEHALVERLYGLDRPANFEGRWHLHIAAPIECDEQSMALLASARDKLLRARERRVRPGCDDKILTAWNAMMIRAMAMAGRILDDKTLVDSALRALDCLRRRLWRDGRLLATCHGDTAHLNAYLDDHAFLIDAILECLQSRWRNEDLGWARQLADAMVTLFEDTDNGGFFFTANDHEPLFHRPKPFVDESTPAGNAIAALALGRLGHLLGEQRYLDAAERTVATATAEAERSPQAHCTLLIAVQERLAPPQIVIVRGPAMHQWHHRLQHAYAPNRLCFAIPAGENDLPERLGQQPAPDETTATVCTGCACLPPARSLDVLLNTLRTA